MQKPVIQLLYLAFIIFCSMGAGGCKDGGSQALGTGPYADMVMESIDGSPVQRAVKLDSLGNVEVEGYVLDGQRTGMWVQYTPEGDLMLVNHFIDGKLDGVAMRYSFRNQADLRTTYRMGQLHGPWYAYKFGKVIEERIYENGQINGVVRLYDDRTFKVKQEMQYKHGKLHGYFRYYDENGNVTVEYEYVNGEKVSGGIKESGD